MSCYFGKIKSRKADAWEEKKEVKKKIQEIHTKILPRAYSCLGFSCVGGHNNGSLQEFSI